MFVLPHVPLNSLFVQQGQGRQEAQFVMELIQSFTVLQLESNQNVINHNDEVKDGDEGPDQSSQRTAGHLHEHGGSQITTDEGEEPVNNDDED